MKYQCQICKSKFSTEERAVSHIEKRHPYSALFSGRAIWATDEVSVWDDGNNEDGRYVLVCERHLTCLNFTSKARALDWSRAPELCTASCEAAN